MCRATASGGAVAVLGTNQQVTWSLTNAALLRNSAAGSGGALALTVPVQGSLCQNCRLQGNTAGLLGGAVSSTAKALCVAGSKQQVGVGARRCPAYAWRIVSRPLVSDHNPEISASCPIRLGRRRTSEVLNKQCPVLLAGLHRQQHHNEQQLSRIWWCEHLHR